MILICVSRISELWVYNRQAGKIGTYWGGFWICWQRENQQPLFFTSLSFTKRKYWCCSYVQTLGQNQYFTSEWVSGFYHVNIKYTSEARVSHYWDIHKYKSSRYKQRGASAQYNVCHLCPSEKPSTFKAEQSHEDPEWSQTLHMHIQPSCYFHIQVF